MAHSQAREMVAQGYTATLVAATLAISRSSLYYQKKPRGSRADPRYDEQIVMACGEKLACGYRRVAWWLKRKNGVASTCRMHPNYQASEIESLDEFLPSCPLIRLRSM